MAPRAWLSSRLACRSSPKARRNRELAAKATDASAKLAGNRTAAPAGRWAESPLTGGGKERACSSAALEQGQAIALNGLCS